MATTNTDDALEVDTGAASGFQAGLNVTFQGAGPELSFFEILQDLGFDTPDGEFQLQLQGTFESVSTLNPILPVQTDADIYLQPIPEPLSVLVWGGLISVFSLLFSRRRA
jgi:hypothetical protein